MKRWIKKCVLIRKFLVLLLWSFIYSFSLKSVYQDQLYTLSCYYLTRFACPGNRLRNSQAQKVMILTQFKLKSWSYWHNYKIHWSHMIFGFQEPLFSLRRFIDKFWTLSLPDGVHSNRPCPSVSPSVSLSVSPSVFKYLGDRSLFFSNFLHIVRAP